VLIHDQELFSDLGTSSAVAFFYFDFKDKEGQAVETALRRIVLQLSAQSLHPYSALDKQYNLSKGQTLPSYQDLQHVFEELLRAQRRTYIVLDALDECKESELVQLMDLISMLREWTGSPLHLLITSQPRTLFTNRLKDVICISLDSGDIENDIRDFVKSELEVNLGLKIWSSRREEVIDRIVSKSSGMLVSSF
jgi:hypothetical protein